MLLKSSRSTRWPYLFRSTVFERVELVAFGRTTWNSSMLSVFAEFVDDVGTVIGVLLLAKVVLVDVLERGTVC